MNGFRCVAQIRIINDPNMHLRAITQDAFGKLIKQFLVRFQRLRELPYRSIIFAKSNKRALCYGKPGARLYNIFQQFYRMRNVPLKFKQLGLCKLFQHVAAGTLRVLLNDPE